MSRLAPAAIQLIEQVTGINGLKLMHVSPVDRPDEGGVHRSIEFDPATSKWLSAALDVIEDERIESVDYAGRGQAVVVFVDDERADDRTPFRLERAHRLLYGRR